MTKLLDTPYLLFLGGADDPRMAKTATGFHYWAAESCLGQLRLPGCEVDLGLPDMRAKEAAEMGAKTLVIGTAPIGGGVPNGWLPVLRRALEAGLDIASGMHAELRSINGTAEFARTRSRRLIDVRQAGSNHPVGTGRKRSGMRLLTVGTDCGIGKMYAALAIFQGLADKGVDATFRATGQTGIMIAGSGLCIDAVVADFMAGAAEDLSPDAPPDHWDVIEGQGSLHHPAFAGVSLGLLHGSQPDVLVVCHDASRKTMVGFDELRVPSLEACIETNMNAAKLVNSAVKVGGICANTSTMPQDQATRWLADTQARFSLPVCDPVRTGVSGVISGLAEYCAA